MEGQAIWFQAFFTVYALWYIQGHLAKILDLKYHLQYNTKMNPSKKFSKIVERELQIRPVEVVEYPLSW